MKPQTLLITLLILLPYTYVAVASTPGYLAIRDYVGTIWTLNDIEKLYNTQVLYKSPSTGEVKQVSYGELFILYVDGEKYSLRDFAEKDGVAVLPLNPGYHSIEVYFGYYHDKYTVNIIEGEITVIDLATAPVKTFEITSTGFRGYEWYAYKTGSESVIVRSDGRVKITIPIGGNTIKVDVDNGETIISRYIQLYGWGYPQHGFDEEQFKFDVGINESYVYEYKAGFDFLGIIKADTGTIVKRVARANFSNPFGVKQIGLYTYTLLITADVKKLELLEHVAKVGEVGVALELLFMPRVAGAVLGGPAAIKAAYNALTWWRAGLTAGTVARGLLAGAGGLALSTYMLGNALQGTYEYITRLCGESVTQTIVYHVVVITTPTRVMVVVYGWFTDPYGRVYPVWVLGHGLTLFPYIVSAGTPNNPVQLLTIAGVADIEYNSVATGYPTSAYTWSQGTIYPSTGYAYLELNGSLGWSEWSLSGDYMYVGSGLDKMYYSFNDIRPYSINIRYNVFVETDTDIYDHGRYGFNLKIRIYTDDADTVYNYLVSKGYSTVKNQGYIEVTIGYTKTILDNKHILFYINKELDFSGLGKKVPANITIGLYDDPSSLDRIYVKLSTWGGGIKVVYNVIKQIQVVPKTIVPVDIVEKGYYTIGKAYAVEINHVRISYNEDYMLGAYLLRGHIPKTYVFRDAILSLNETTGDIKAVYIWLVIPANLLEHLTDMMVVSGTSVNDKTYIYVDIRSDLDYFENATFMFLGLNSWSILYLPPEVASMLWEPGTPPDVSGRGIDILVPSGKIVTIRDGELYVYNEKLDNWRRVNYTLVNTSYIITAVDNGETITVIDNGTVDIQNYYKYIDMENNEYKGWLWNDNLTLRLIVAAQAVNTLPPEVFRELWEKAQPTPPQIYISLFDDKLLAGLGAWWSSNWWLIALGAFLFILLLILLLAARGPRIVIASGRR